MKLLAGVLNRTAPNQMEFLYLAPKVAFLLQAAQEFSGPRKKKR